jgi:hypothetical protein
MSGCTDDKYDGTMFAAFLRDCVDDVRDLALDANEVSAAYENVEYLAMRVCEEHSGATPEHAAAIEREARAISGAIARLRALTTSDEGSR